MEAGKEDRNEGDCAATAVHQPDLTVCLSDQEDIYI